MAVRTKRLAAGVFQGTTVTTYTVPEGETAIAKFLTLFNQSSTTASVVTVRIVIGADSRTVVRRSLAALESVLLDLWLVLHPGDQVTMVRNSGADDQVYTLSGTELEGVAD